MHIFRITPLLGLLLLASCFLAKEKKSELSIPYQLSYDLPVYENDKYLKSFLSYAGKNDDETAELPDSIWLIAKIASEKIRNELPPQSPERINRLEIIHFILLDKYLLPVYVKNGNKEIEEMILSSLVNLQELDSNGELLLQVKALHIISQGGFYYPELQEHYRSLLASVETVTPEHEKALSLLSDLEQKMVH